jgi:hypothetical protein
MHVGSNKITRMQLKLITTHAIQNRVCVALVAIQNLFCPAVRLLCLTCHASWVHISESEVRSQLTVKKRNRSKTSYFTRMASRHVQDQTPPGLPGISRLATVAKLLRSTGQTQR